MYNFEEAHKVDIALAAERYAIKWKPIAKAFMMSKGLYEKLNMENCSIDIVQIDKEVFFAIQPGDNGICMKSRKGTQKSRNLTPSTYGVHLHDLLIAKGWKAGSSLDLEDCGLITEGKWKDAHMYRVINDDSAKASEPIPEIAEEVDLPPVTDVPQEETF